MIAGYAVKRLSASLSPRDRRESGRAVPGGAHRARSALSASTGESTVAARAARETPGVLGRNGEAPSDRSLGASVYRPSPLVGDEREMARRSEPFTNPFATLSAGQVLNIRTDQKASQGRKFRGLSEVEPGRSLRFALSRNECEAVRSVPVSSPARGCRLSSRYRQAARTLAPIPRPLWPNTERPPCRDGRNPGAHVGA